MSAFIIVRNEEEMINHTDQEKLTLSWYTNRMKYGSLGRLHQEVARK